MVSGKKRVASSALIRSCRRQRVGRVDEVATFAKGPGTWRTCRVLEIFWKTCEQLSSAPSGRGGGEVWRIEISFDTGQGGGGFLGCVAVVQRLPRALHFLQDLVRGGFPVNGLGVLIPSVEKLSNILLQCLDRCHRAVLQTFPVHFPE